MIHESDYSHFDLFSSKNLHAGIHLLNTSCVLLSSVSSSCPALPWAAWNCSRHGFVTQDSKYWEMWKKTQSSSVSVVAENNFHAAGLTRRSCVVRCYSLPRHRTSCHREWNASWNMERWDEVECQPRFSISLRKTISAAVTQVLPTAPCTPQSVSFSHTHSSYSLFSCWQETPYLEGYALLVIHLLLKYWVAFRLWHFELSGWKNVTLTTNFEVWFLNALTVYSLLLFLSHFKLL